MYLPCHLRLHLFFEGRERIVAENSRNIGLKLFQSRADPRTVMLLREAYPTTVPEPATLMLLIPNLPALVALKLKNATA